MTEILTEPKRHVHVIFRARNHDIHRRHTIEERSIGEVLIMVMNFIQEKSIFTNGTPFMVIYTRGEESGDPDRIDVQINVLNKFKHHVEIDECYCENWGEDSADPPF